MVQLNPDKNIWTPVEIIQCPTQDGRSYSLKTVHGRVYTRNRRFIKPDQTEHLTPTQEPPWNKELPDPPGLSRSQIDSLSLNKTIMNSKNSLEALFHS